MQKLISIVYIVSDLDKVNEFEWLIDGIDKQKFELSFISLNQKEDTFLNQYCVMRGIPFYHIQYASKKDFLQALFTTIRLLRKLRPEIVHAHLFEGGLIGITAAWIAGVKKRIYTRHYSNYHHKFAKNGLKYDKWINSKSTDIVAITRVVYDILTDWEKVPKRKVHLIYHGFPTNNFMNVDPDRIALVKDRNSIPTSKKIIGVVSRYTEWKGVHYIIPAFKRLLANHPNIHLVLANAKGDYSNEIKKLLAELPPYAYTEIDYENDNIALFKCFDYFVHVPIDSEAEAFGQIYIESMLLGIPSLFTKSGIAAEICTDKVNCIIADFQNIESIFRGLEMLLGDEVLCEKIRVNSIHIAEKFTFESKLSKLEGLYLTVGIDD